MEALQEIVQKRSGRQLAGGLVGICSWLYLAVVVGLWGLLAAADLWWPATFFLFSPRWVAAAPLAGLLPAALALQRRALWPLLLALVLVTGPVMGFCLPWQRLLASPPAGKPFRVLTCNMHYYTRGTQALERLVADARPDIVLLQEWRGSEGSFAFSGSAWHTHDVRGLFLASVYPLRRATQFGKESASERGSLIQYELQTPVGVVNVFSLHLVSPRDGLAKVVYERGAAADDLEAASELRWRQSELVARVASKVSGPLILAGDFNTPPESALFRSIWGRYTDAFGFAGWGWGYTFRGNRTLVRIDHILAGPEWHCNACWVGPNIGSPHRPVLADLTWPAKD